MYYGKDLRYDSRYDEVWSLKRFWTHDSEFEIEITVKSVTLTLLILVILFVPWGMEAYTFLSKYEIIYPEAPLLTVQQLEAEKEAAKESYIKANKPEEFFATVARSKALERSIDKFHQVHGRIESYKLDNFMREVNGAMKYSSDMMNNKFNNTQLSLAREKFVEEIDGKKIVPNTHALLYLGNSYLVTCWIMSWCLPFGRRA